MTRNVRVLGWPARLFVYLEPKKGERGRRNHVRVIAQSVYTVKDRVTYKMRNDRGNTKRETWKGGNQEMKLDYLIIGYGSLAKQMSE